MAAKTDTREASGALMNVLDLETYRERQCREKYRQQARELEHNLIQFNTAWECMCALPERMLIQLVQKAKRHGMFKLRDLSRKFEENTE